jgi:hypothetical protein
MMLSTNGLIFAVLFLALGLVELFVFMRLVHPVLSLRHENQKVTYSQGRSPAFIANIIRLQSLIVMPLLGYYVSAQVYGGN